MRSTGSWQFYNSTLSKYLESYQQHAEAETTGNAISCCFYSCGFLKVQNNPSILWFYSSIHRSFTLSTESLMCLYYPHLLPLSRSLRPSFLPLSPCGFACMILLSPSGPHWRWPLSFADNYCHLHIAQYYKHLMALVASHSIAVLV